MAKNIRNNKRSVMRRRRECACTPTDMEAPGHLRYVTRKLVGFEKKREEIDRISSASPHLGGGKKEAERCRVRQR